MMAVGCGKKGPPIAPIIHVPAAVERIDTRRKGSEAILTFTVPAKNVDGTMPADVARIEVYGYTGVAAPPRTRFLDVATLVGTVTVPPMKPDDPAPPAPRDPSKAGEPIQGGLVSVRESLTEELLVPKPIPPPPSTTRALAPLPPSPTTASSNAETAIRRFYLALAFSPRGRPGPPGTIAELPLTVLPDAPDNVTATSTADSVVVEWEPAGGLIGFILERALAKELSPLDDTTLDTSMPSIAPLPDGPTRYNVYREIAPPAAAAPQSEPPPAPTSSAPDPINSMPISTLTLADPLPALDGRERCYTVSAVRGSGVQTVEGDRSMRACVTPTDDFPPAPPSGLSTIPAEGSISLIWEPNSEADVAGYLVLRGEAGDATLTPLTDTVVTEARYTDSTVRPGVRYVYAVQAIDTHLPRPNVSAESARVEDMAR